MTLSLKNDVNVASKSKPDPLVRGADPGPYPNVTDPQHQLLHRNFWCIVFSAGYSVLAWPLLLMCRL
jgi:hypothetical protein